MTTIMLTLFVLLIWGAGAAFWMWAQLTEEILGERWSHPVIDGAVSLLWPVYGVLVAWFVWAACWSRSGRAKLDEIFGTGQVEAGEKYEEHA